MSNRPKRRKIKDDSKNQRIINVKPSLKKQKAVLVKEYIIRDKLVK